MPLKNLKNLDRHERIRLLHLGDSLHPNCSSFLEILTPTISQFIHSTVSSTASTPISPSFSLQPLTVKRRRRQGCIFNHSPSSSNSSLDSVLSLQTQSSSSGESFEISQQPCQPKPLRITPPSHLNYAEDFLHPISPPPLSPSSFIDLKVIPSTDERRQKRLHKLIRVLGEDLPIEIIHTPDCSSFAESGRGRGGQPQVDDCCQPVSLNSPLTFAPPSRSRWSADSAQYISHCTAAPALPHNNATWSQTKQISIKRVLPPILRRRRASALHRDGGGRVRDWGKRKEKEWSGEWNMRDIQDVVRGLRQLKAR